jgi:hypothetical protein
LKVRISLILVVAFLLGESVVEAQDRWRGYWGTEARAFGSAPAFPGQADGGQFSLLAEPEYYREWAAGRDSFTFSPFVRLDSQDPERTHFDVRELYWQRAARGWELRVGLSKVFWGVTESQHLVDIVNQTDLIESVDGEEKLGQPMIKLTLARRWGIVDLFVLPGFRERTFPGVDGRLRPPIPINADDALYESSAEDSHVDFAGRWSHAIGPFDIGVSHFRGTSRDPRFVPRRSGSGAPELVPFYEQIDQTGMDFQATIGSWLWKLEAIRRDGLDGPFAAATGGFEYTFWSVASSSIDIGALAEYLWDERGVTAVSPFANDLFVGTRLAFNDVQDTTILAGLVSDLDGHGRSLLLEASRRLAGSWVLEVEARGFSGARLNDPLAWLGGDDYFQVGVLSHF